MPNGILGPSIRRSLRERQFRLRRAEMFFAQGPRCGRRGWYGMWGCLTMSVEMWKQRHWNGATNIKAPPSTIATSRRSHQVLPATKGEMMRTTARCSHNVQRPPKYVPGTSFQHCVCQTCGKERRNETQEGRFIISTLSQNSGPTNIFGFYNKMVSDLKSVRLCQPLG